jgi:hypothetical protein
MRTLTTNAGRNKVRVTMGDSSRFTSTDSEVIKGMISDRMVSGSLLLHDGTGASWRLIRPAKALQTNLFGGR